MNNNFKETAIKVCTAADGIDLEFSAKFRSFLINNSDIAEYIFERLPEKIFDVTLYDEKALRDVVTGSIINSACTEYTKQDVDECWVEIMNTYEDALSSYLDSISGQDTYDVAYGSALMALDRSLGEKKLSEAVENAADIRLYRHDREVFITIPDIAANGDVFAMTLHRYVHDNETMKDAALRITDGQELEVTLQAWWEEQIGFLCLKCKNEKLENFLSSGSAQIREARKKIEKLRTFLEGYSYDTEME